MHDGGQGQVLFESGVEGLHWEQDGDNLKQLPKISKADEVMEKSFISPFYRVTPLIYDNKKIDYESLRQIVIKMDPHDFIDSIQKRNIKIQNKTLS